MKILVTGAGGFLGGHLVESLLRHGQRQLRLHFRKAPPDGGIDELQKRFPDAKLQVAVANLLRPSQLNAAVAGIDMIIHCAAAKRGTAADIFLNTVVGTRNLLDAALVAGCKRIVLVSSFAMFRSADLSAGALLDEDCAIETDGIEKGAYGFAKVQQERLVWRFQRQHGFECVVLRPGVIYGPGDSSISARVGLKVGPIFFVLGGRNLLPLVYVENCADAVVVASLRAPSGSVFSVVDDDLPTCNQYLSLYRRQVEKLRTVRVPRVAFALAVRWMVNYQKRSQGQLPAIFTSHILRSMYRRLHYSNKALKSIGWEQCVTTRQGLINTFARLRGEKRV